MNPSARCLDSDRCSSRCYLIVTRRRPEPGVCVVTVTLLDEAGVLVDDPGVEVAVVPLLLELFPEAVLEFLPVLLVLLEFVFDVVPGVTFVAELELFVVLAVRVGGVWVGFEGVVTFLPELLVEAGVVRTVVLVFVLVDVLVLAST